MSIVVLAEKPSQAKDYAEAFKNVSRKKGYYEVNDSRFFNKKTYITWCIGHLVGLVEPEKYKKEWGEWSLDSLPIIPKQFKFQVASDSGRKAQFNVVKRLLKNCSEIIVATDADREGENIARSVIDLAGVEGKTMKRLWINSLVVTEIQKGFRDLRNGVDFIPLYDEAKTRQLADWVVGMNATRLYTLLLQKKGLQGAFSVGRVQSPTLFLIHKRQEEIANFKSKPFYELEGRVNVEGGSFLTKYKGRFDRENQVGELLEKHGLNEDEHTGVISNVVKEGKKTSSPTLHSLSSLQTRANRLWKYSPSDVLSIVQSLYEKKVLSYPRTETEHITENEFAYLKKHLNKYKYVLGIEFDPVYLEPRKRYVDDSKVQEHYAIVPTIEVVQLDTLNEKERNIYKEVLATTVAMFMGDYKYEQTKIDVDANGLLLHAKGNVELDKGWKAVFPSNKKDNKKEDVLPSVVKDEACSIALSKKKGMTSPPKPYTEGGLINMMKFAGKDLDEESREVLKDVEGIGTGATRSGIIETLKRQKYIEIKKNVVHVTKKGEVLCKAIDGTLLASAEMTARWEGYLAKIGRREGSQKAFLDSVEKFVLSLIETAPKDVENLSGELTSLSNENIVAPCPECDGNIVDKGKFYGCSGYREGCRFSLPKKLASKTIPKTQIVKLINEGETNKIKGFKSKKGKSFDASLKLEGDKVKFDFGK